MLKLYNIRIRRKEIFKPIRTDWVGLYTCGPTVYNFAHIGNLRTYIFEDILRRTLEYAGYRVRQVMNITDVDDKIIRDARAAGKTIFEFIQPYETAFFDDIKKLNIKTAWKYPKATDHIREMIRLVEKLLKNGFAYQADDDSVYFDISKFKNYGRLSRLTIRELKTGVRIAVDEYSKEDAKDFVLWKSKKEGEPSWPAPFGEGRPGWHLECSAMSMKYLGEIFDVHGGAVDLIFPHHENEIAQSEGATGKSLAHFFVEGEHLLINDKKMSKSIGTVYTLRDIEARGVDPRAFRYLMLTAHYRSKLNFTWESLEAAQHSLERLYQFVKTLRGVDPIAATVSFVPSLARHKENFQKAVLNDLDTSRGLAVLWDMMREYHKDPDRFDVKAVLDVLFDFDQILGLGLANIKKEKIPAVILRMTARRGAYRKQEQWAKADDIRKKIEEAGYEIKDTSQGPRVKKN